MDNLGIFEESLYEEEPTRRQRRPTAMPEFVECKCKRQCSSFSIDDKNSFRESFTDLADWNSKSVFLASCMKIVSYLAFSFSIKLFSTTASFC